MGFPRIPSIFRPSPTAPPDDGRVTPEQAPRRDAPHRPRSRGAGILTNLSRLTRLTRHSIAAPAPDSADRQASGAEQASPPPDSPPPDFKLPRQNALSAKMIREFDPLFPRSLPAPSGFAGTSDLSPARTLAEQMALREQILARQPPMTAQRYIPVEALEPALQKAYLTQHDPVKALGLTDRSVFYRALDRRYLLTEGGRTALAGNANSGAHIHHHLRLLPSSGLANETEFASQPARARERLLDDPMWQYDLVSMVAKNLPDPTLNVMFGEQAEQGARGYAKTANHVVVSMTLGDLRNAGGGQVFLDTRAAARSDGTHPLIVTLPEGKTIPVTILPAGQPGASTSKR
ncbi:AvrPphF family type III effector [Ralstonia solanacearum]|uniref:AvrPphF family type III effector n=1 Tax=Ralstonia solanacearum TaxID=305 RepID=UPI00168AE245|nr:AvrPphF family type III effector [Ralstonia solanacearum]AYB54008.2 type III effector protein, AvrPphF family [Ralstonia solanacearum]AYB58558.2 type III effector protein, AvrPphF family [Ralstonia solanacearum]